MNSTQIKYIRECLSIRKRQLLSQHCQDLPTPPEVLEAQMVVDRYRDARCARREAIRSAIERRIRSVEESLILGGDDSGIAAALAELDEWTPNIS